jgi:hypothetical protein
MNGLNLNNAVQYHVWQHLILLGEVNTKTYMEGNTVMSSGILGPEAMTETYGREEFYVDPRNGTLQKTKRSSSKYRRDKTPSNDSYYDPKKPLTQFHKIGDIWYEFKFREATAEEKKNKSFGEIGREFIGLTSNWESKWRPMSHNKFVEQIVGDKKTGYYYYRHDRLWSDCESLFGGAYLPTEKRQISSKEIRKVEVMIEARNRKILRKVA